jgi:pantothenate kinase type III
VVRRIKHAWPRPSVPLVIATGGFAETMATLCASFDRVEPYLTLQGLQIAHAILRGSPSSLGAETPSPARI